MNDLTMSKSEAAHYDKMITIKRRKNNMTIEKLIEILKKYDSDMRVVTGTMRSTWNLYHAPLEELYTETVRSDMLEVMRKELRDPELKKILLL